MRMMSEARCEHVISMCALRLGSSAGSGFL